MSHFPLTMNRIHFISRRFVSKPHLRPSKQSKERLSSALFSSYTLPPPHNHGLAPIPLKNGQKLVALGDIHGDFSALVRALKVAQVIDQAATVTLETIESVAWVGGDRILVQLGDVLDRGISECSCWRLLTSLARQAEEKNGSVHMLYGNHEVLNMLNVWNYVEPGGDNEFDQDFGHLVTHNPIDGTSGSRSKALSPGHGSLIEPLISNFNLALQVGSTVLVHGGLTREHLLQNGGSIGKLNEAAREFVKTDFGNDKTKMRLKMPDFFGGGVSAQFSPIWMREYSKPSGGPVGYVVSHMIDALFEEIDKSNDLGGVGGVGGVERICVGHTPQEKLNSVLDGKIWRIDTGLSSGVAGGVAEVLQVEGIEGGMDIVTVLSERDGAVEGEAREIFRYD